MTGEKYYLTLEKGKSLADYSSIRLDKIYLREEDELNQIWAFDLARNYHFSMKNLGSEIRES